MAVDHNNPQSRNEEILIATIDGNEYNKPPQSRIEELLLELKEVIEAGGGGGTSDYTKLQNLPTINNITVTGDMTAADLSLVLAEVGKGLSTNDYSNEEKAKVASLLTSIQSILDGSDIDSFGDVEVALLDKADISDLGTAAAKNSTNAVTSGSMDLVESGAVKDAIDAAVSSAYHHAGTKTVAQLTHDLLVAANEGNVYNITDSGTTTSDFIEGIGKTIDEGSNVGICKVGNAYMFDLLSGFVDTTNFVQKSQTAGLLKNDGTVNDEIEGDVSTLKSGLTNYQAQNDINLEVPDRKNMLPMTVESIKAANTVGTWNGNIYSINGITYTIEVDTNSKITGITVYGSKTDTSATSRLFLATGLNASDYVGMLLNGCPNMGGENYGEIYVQAIGGSYSVIADDYGDTTGVIIRSTSASKVRVGITVGNSFNVDAANAITFYPMIRPATITDPTFAPYIPSVESRIEAIERNDFSAATNIKDYNTTDNMFIATNDGYIVAETTNSVIVRLYGSANAYVNIKIDVSNNNYLYVKKGMKLYVFSNTNSDPVYFIPLT